MPDRTLILSLSHRLREEVAGQTFLMHAAVSIPFRVFHFEIGIRYILLCRVGLGDLEEDASDNGDIDRRNMG